MMINYTTNPVTTAEEIKPPSVFVQPIGIKLVAAPTLRELDAVGSTPADDNTVVRVNLNLPSLEGTAA